MAVQTRNAVVQYAMAVYVCLAATPACQSTMVAQPIKQLDHRHPDPTRPLSAITLDVLDGQHQRRQHALDDLAANALDVDVWA